MTENNPAAPKIHSEEYLREWRSRRAMLKGLGLGALLFSPLMRSLAARAAGMGSPRLVIMFTPNGFYMPKMTVRKSGQGATPDRPVFSDSLAALSGLSDQILVLRNLDSTLETDGFAKSHEQQAALITGFSTKRNNGNVNYQVAQGPSIDWAIARARGQEPLGLGVMFDPGSTYKHLWSASGIPNDPVNNPKDLVSRLFPSVAQPSPSTDGISAAVAQQEFDRCTLLRDALLDDTRKLRARLGTDDKARIDPYLESLEGTRCSLGTPVPPTSTCVAPGISSGVDFGANAAWRARADAQLDVIVSAFKCGYRDVATLSFASGVSGANVSDPGKSSHHEWSHTNENNLDPAKTVELIDKTYVQFYADMLEKFRKESLLQDVMVLWMSELVDGNSHNQDNRQWLVGGGGAGRLRTGRVVEFSGGAKDRCTNKLCVTLAQAMGMNIDTFGDSSLLTAGPLAGVLA